MQNDTGYSIQDAVSMAKRKPDVYADSSGKSTSMPDVFDNLPNLRDTPYIQLEEQNEEKVSLETYYLFNSSVFVLDIPYEICPRCRRDMDTGNAELPSEGSFKCPHTDLNAYTALINESLHGEAIIQSREFYMTMEGIRKVHVEWLIGDPDKRKEIQTKAKSKQRNRVYPANPPSLEEFLDKEQASEPPKTTKKEVVKTTKKPSKKTSKKPSKTKKKES